MDATTQTLMEWLNAKDARGKEDWRKNSVDFVEEIRNFVVISSIMYVFNTFSCIAFYFLLVQFCIRGWRFFTKKSVRETIKKLEMKKMRFVRRVPKMEARNLLVTNLKEGKQYFLILVF